MKFPVKIRKKLKKLILSPLFFFGYENKENYPIYVSKRCCEKKYIDLLLMVKKKKEKKVKGTIMYVGTYGTTLHRWWKMLCCYCLQTLKKLKRHMKYCFKINGKWRIKTLKKVNKLDTKSFSGERFGEKTLKILTFIWRSNVLACH